MQTPDDRGTREHARGGAGHHVGVMLEPRAPRVRWCCALGRIPHCFGSLCDSVKGCGLRVKSSLVHGQCPPSGMILRHNEV